MKFNIIKERLLLPLQRVSNIVGRKQKLPILSYLLFKITPDSFSITATDTEVELITTVKEKLNESGNIAVPAQKLLDICRNLPSGADLAFEVEKGRALIRSRKSRFTLSTLPVAEFPVMDTATAEFCFTVEREAFGMLIEKVRFAMAQQDVRYYLNGLLVEVEPDQLKVVASDGHRLALGTLVLSTGVSELQQFIIPRKGVTELVRLLSGKKEKEVEIQVSTNFISAEIDDTCFTSKLVDGTFPNYQQVIPDESSDKLVVSREELKQGLMRVAILSNERHHNVRLVLTAGKIKLFSRNLEQEEAEEEIDIQYKGGSLEVGFNISYLLEVLDNIDTEQVFINIFDSNSSCLILPEDESQYKYVVMPVRL